VATARKRYVRQPSLASLPGASAVPLAVLFGLNLVDELDRIGFATLAPEIRDDFGVSDAVIVSISSGAGALAILAAVPVGYLADRYDRVRLSIIGAVLWAGAAIATGMAQVLVVLAVARFASGAGRLVNDPVHASLLADWYPARSLPTVSAIHRLATNLGAVLAGPAVGLLAVVVGWRVTFLLVALPALLLAAVALRLRDPRQAAGAASRSGHGFREAFLVLRAKKTMNRIWAVAFFYGAAFIPLVASMISVLFDRAYGLGPGGRGLVLSGFGIGGAAGLFVGRHFAARALAGNSAPQLMRVVAWSVTALAGLLLLLAGVTLLPVAVGLTVGVAIAAYGYIPAYLTLMALVTRPQYRAQAYAYALLFSGIGGLVAAQLLPLALQGGVRPAVATLGAAALGGALIAHRAAPYVSHDLEQPPGELPMS
jgi:predicted MFS family arabinose efflux permease